MAWDDNREDELEYATVSVHIVRETERAYLLIFSEHNGIDSDPQWVPKSLTGTKVLFGKPTARGVQQADIDIETWKLDELGVPY